MTMTLIQTVTVTAGGASTIDFTSIPQTYTDLYVVYSLRTAGTNGGLRIKVNGATTDLTTRLIYGTGASATGATDTTYIGTSNNSNQTANNFNNGSLYLSGYATAYAKPISVEVVDENNATTPVNQWVTGGRYNSSTAVTSLTLYNDAATTFVQYSSASLYGVNNSVTNGTPKATGGTITYGIGGIVYHTFTSSGTFTPSSSFTADVLVVGGGGRGASGGGGAGGYRTGSLTVSSPVTVTVGAGQAGAAWSDGGGSGSSSTFDTITSAGGGAGGSVNSNNAVAGGSGGGGAGQSSGGPGNGAAGNTPSTSPAQGSNGGSWNGYANNQYGAGGGGASAVGGNSNATSNGGAGGAGTTWLNGTTYAVGGKGMEANGTGASGAANTGTGGAGGFAGGSGGSGIVIVRYQG